MKAIKHSDSLTLVILGILGQFRHSLMTQSGSAHIHAAVDVQHTTGNKYVFIVEADVHLAPIQSEIILISMPAIAPPSTWMAQPVM